MSAPKKSFCIARLTDEKTGVEYGDNYGEPVVVRRPTSADRISISTRHAGILSAYGANPSDIPEGLSMLAYIFCFLDVLCDPQTRPDWTKRENVYEEDEAAVFALFKEVSAWIDTFRQSRT